MIVKMLGPNIFFRFRAPLMASTESRISSEESRRMLYRQNNWLVGSAANPFALPREVIW